MRAVERSPVSSLPLSLHSRTRHPHAQLHAVNACANFCVHCYQGRTTVPLQNGVAYFTDLGIDLSGSGYSLKFTYSGLTQLQAVESSIFRVEKPVAFLEQIDKDKFGGTVTAGESFIAQPVVELRGSDQKILANTVLPVTASINMRFNPGDWQRWNFCKDKENCLDDSSLSSPNLRDCGGPEFQRDEAEGYCKCVVPGQGVTQVGYLREDSCPSTLLGQTVGIPVEGTVRFTDLALTKASEGQYLNDTYPGISPQSYVLTISLGKIATNTGVLRGGIALFVKPAKWESIMIPPYGQPKAKNIAGKVLEQQPIVILVDRFNNRVLPEDIPEKTYVSVSIHSFDGPAPPAPPCAEPEPRPGCIPMPLCTSMSEWSSSTCWQGLTGKVLNSGSLPPITPPIVRRGCYGRGEFVEERDYLDKMAAKGIDLRNSLKDCEGCPSCDPPRPIVCRHCPDLNISASSAVDGYIGEAIYSDLELVIEGEYKLVFTCWDSVQGRQLSTVSRQFAVINSDPSYPFALESVPAVNSAELPFEVQPKLTVKDNYGNFVRFDTRYKGQRTVSVKIVGPTPIAPTFQEKPYATISQTSLAPGQVSGTVCRCDSRPAPTPFEGTMVVPIDSNTGIGQFTNLVMRQVYENYRLQFTISSSTGNLVLNSDKFAVQPGDTVGLCPLQLPSKCGARAPCFVSLEVGCVDKYGNIQPTCNTKRGARTLNPTKIPKGYEYLPCSTGMCVKLVSGPEGAFVSSPTLSGGISCSKQRCQLEFYDLGKVRFSDIQMSLAGERYSLAVYSYLIDPYTHRIEKWEYVTPHFDVFPPAPIVRDVFFSPSMNQIYVLFDRPTSMNEGVRKARSAAVVQANQWDPVLRMGPCEQELTEEFIATLGFGTFCTWFNTTQYLISLGAGATVTENTQFHLSPISNIVYSEVVNGRKLNSLPALTTVGVNVGGRTIPALSPRLPSVLPAPSPQIMGPSQYNVCSKFAADASMSSGKGARPFSKIQWAVDFSNSKRIARGGILGALDTPQFTRREIHWTDPVPDSLVVVTVTLRPNYDMLPGTSISISGLPGYLETKMDAETCEKPEGLKEVKCKWGRPYDDCVVVPIMGPNASLFSSHFRQAHAGPEGEWVTGGIDGQMEDTSRKQANIVVTVRDGHYLPSLSNTVFSFVFLAPGLASMWFTNEVRARPEVPVNVEIEVAGNGDSSITCLTQNCAEPIIKTIPKAPMTVPGSRGLQNSVFQLEQHPVTPTLSLITEQHQINTAMNKISLTFVISRPLASGSRILLFFDGLTAAAGFTEPTSKLCLEGSIAHVFTCASCNRNGSKGSLGPPRSWATWADETLTFIVRPGASVAAGRHSISFVMQNPNQAMREACDSPTLFSKQLNKWLCSSKIKVRLQLLFPSHPGKIVDVFGDVLGASVPPILGGSVTESSQMQGLMNILTIELNSNLDMLPNSTLTISGITGQVAVGYGKEGQILHCQGGPCTCLNVTDNAPLKLKIQLLENPSCRGIVAGSVTKFAVLVRNPLSQQAPALLSVQGDYSGCAACAPDCACLPTLRPKIVFPKSVLKGEVLGAAIALHLDASISESNPVPGQANQLTIRTSGNIGLPPGTVYRFVGLKGMLPLNADINYRGQKGIDVKAAFADWKARHAASGNSSVFPVAFRKQDGRAVSGIKDSLGFFNMTSGLLSWTLVDTLPAKEQLSFTLNLLNRELPYDERDDKQVEGFKFEGNSSLNLRPEIYLALSSNLEVCEAGAAAGTICPLTADKRHDLRKQVSGSAQALNAEPAFLYARVSESSKVLGTSDVLTFAMKLNVALRGEDVTIEVSGLGQVSSASSSECFLVKKAIDFLPVCMCTEGDFCESCDADRLSRLSSSFFVWIPDLEHPDLYVNSPDREPGSVRGLCDWNQETGIFTLPLLPGQNIAADQEFRFSVNLINDKQQRPAARPTIAVKIGGVKFESFTEDEVLGGGADAEWLSATLTVDSLMVGELAELYVHLEPNLVLSSSKPPGTMITLQGLQGFDTTSGLIQLLGPHAHLVSKNAQALWDQQSGEVHLFGATIFGPVDFSLRLEVAGAEVQDGVELNLTMPSPRIAMTSMYTSIPSTPMKFIVPLLSASSRRPQVTYANASQVPLSLLCSRRSTAAHTRSRAHAIDCTADQVL